MDYQKLRERMVEEQIRSRGITDARVIDALRKVKRHAFIPEALINSAYEDHPVPIGEGQTISQPYIVALMSESLRLTGNEKVLEVGTGSGYQAAVLAELAKEVYSIERIASLQTRAESLLAELGYRTVHLKSGDGTLGWPQEAPFERIIITAAAAKVPPALIEQLAEGGLLIAPIGEDRLSQILTLIEKKGATLISTPVCGCVFVPLIGKHGLKDQ
ncbi:MAG: protein-L-isoaspartate(D-aspartate) O-methyltransferase [Candidatus Omnitrophica bacterium]|nr:protein-L-isoaspartate(D-aspartate) O-methyltransferase [Candidatus Omnitrophota bacterium]